MLGLSVGHHALCSVAETPIVKPSMMPGSGCTGPKPVSTPTPTQPDQIATNAGAASRTTGQRRTPRAEVVPAGSPPSLRDQQIVDSQLFGLQHRIQQMFIEAGA